MFVICGAGILGLTIARELVERGVGEIFLLEKEPELGVHSSGRNSGVLHAGIYYTPDSLKAQFCYRGNLLMRQYCKERGIPILETGKVIVTKRKEELETLEELYRRAKRSGVPVEMVGEKELKEIEPYAKTVEKALYSPFTAVVPPQRILHALEQELLQTGKVKILKKVRFLSIKEKKVVTTRGWIPFDFFVNAAGSYADTVAHAFSLGRKYRILPFKGTYQRLRRRKSHLVRGNIYPVPDLRNPFLGVHFTKGVDGTVYIGPTAIPAFGRENYGLLQGIDEEFPCILWGIFLLFFYNSKFRKVALTEPRKYFPREVYKDAAPMLEGIKPEDILPSPKVGIRPQLVDWEEKELVMDFLVLKDRESVHILNAISPGFTSAFAFAKYVVEHYIVKEF